MKLRYLFPLFAIFLIVIALWRGLNLHAETIPSTLIGKPVPTFSLPILPDTSKQLTQTIFLHHVSLLNVWSVTCSACAAEHAFLLQLANNKTILLYGMNYHDSPEAARTWLMRYGNPYQAVLLDTSGDTAIDWGVYGTPETFIIDKHAHIRYRQLGAMNETVWRETLLPLIQKLQQE